MNIVYVVERFPERSQTFVQNEVRELHRLGVTPRIFALYPPTSIDPTAGDLRFELVPDATRNVVRLIAAAVKVARRHRRGLVRAVVHALRRPSLLQLHAVARTLLVVDALGSEAPQRFHAHFARASASVAMLASMVVGARFSFTAHARDVFVEPFDVDRKLRAAEPAVTVCDYNRRYIADRWPGLGRVVVIPCGVRPEDFRRRGPYSKEPFTIVAVGRLVEKKGFDVLIRACALLRDRGVSFRCRILGDGPQRQRLEDLVHAHGLDRSVDLEGSASTSEVRDALEQASIFCLPAVVSATGDRDSQPVVIKEAMAMEIPVVASDEVGNPEMVDHENGRLVPPGDVEALAAALAGMAATDEEDLRQMGLRGRRRVEERFSLAQQATALVACWASDADVSPW